MVFERTLSEIVDENFIYARALHYLGVSFFENPNKSLREICADRGLEEEQVIKSFYEFDSNERVSFSELSKYPTDLLIAYLKHAHYVFIKEKLPYIVHLAQHCEHHVELQKLLPEFIEDFIVHIYEEEDHLFKYVMTLSEVEKGVANPVSRLIAFKKFSLQAELDHHQDEDEMQAIRILIDEINPTSQKEEVLIKEVKALDREMLYHAEIENKILFPKALALESQVADLLKRISSQN